MGVGAPARSSTVCGGDLAVTYTYTRKTGYYVIARRGYEWKRLLGPFASFTDAHRAMPRVTLPDGADRLDVEKAHGSPLRIIGDMG